MSPIHSPCRSTPGAGPQRTQATDMGPHRSAAGCALCRGGPWGDLGATQSKTNRVCNSCGMLDANPRPLPSLRRAAQVQVGVHEAQLGLNVRAVDRAER